MSLSCRPGLKFFLHRTAVYRTRYSRGHEIRQTVSTADQKWHFHFPQCPVQSTTISQLQTYRSETDPDYKSQFPTVEFSMPLVWQRRRERETSYMMGLTAVFAPSPLGGGACGAPRPPRVGWCCGITRAPLNRTRVSIITDVVKSSEKIQSS